MAWVAGVGDLWRSGGDIRAQWRSILGNAHGNNKWAPNARPGHYNDADMLEIGNGDLSLAEQRSHFALWCLMKSPLIIGADVRSLPAASLAILKNAALIKVNQDSLGIQGTLRVAMDGSGKAAPLVPARTATCVTTPCPEASPWMTHCSFGTAAKPQQWAISSDGMHLTSAKQCLARASEQPGAAVHAVTCDAGSTLQAWDFGGANRTVAQIRGHADASTCLTFNSSSLHMEACATEAGDKTKPNPTGCKDGGCRFSGIVSQLWYLNSLGQLTSAITCAPGIYLFANIVPIPAVISVLNPIVPIPAFTSVPNLSALATGTSGTVDLHSSQ